jgi:hypothetical protein
MHIKKLNYFPPNKTFLNFNYAYLEQLILLYIHKKFVYKLSKEENLSPTPKNKKALRPLVPP